MLTQIIFYKKNKCTFQKKLQEGIYCFTFLQISLMPDLKLLDSHKCLCIKSVPICCFIITYISSST